MKCPICHGTGTIEKPHDGDTRHDQVQLRAWHASILRRRGYSLRQIQKRMGFGSQNSVVYLLKRYPTK